MSSLRIASRIAVVALLLAVPTWPVLAQNAAGYWTMDDILGAESAGSFDISPDGRYVVWTKSQLDREKGRRYANLWVTRVEDGESWALTQGKDSFGSPRFSPDGRLIAFTSSREVPDRSPDASGSQLWVLRMAGGEAWALTTTARGLRQFEWKGESSDTIVFTAQ